MIPCFDEIDRHVFRKAAMLGIRVEKDPNRWGYLIEGSFLARECLEVRRLQTDYEHRHTRNIKWWLTFAAGRHSGRVG